ncbi:MAG: hypothetical protein KAT52_04025 [Desulfobacterales bacterium]|nr:hypothetical protein [Desulfobacterales bacterium]
MNKAKLHPYCESDIWQDMPYYSKPNSIYMDTQKKQANEYHTHLESRDGGGGEPTSTCGIRLSKEYDDHYWMPHYTKFAIITHAEHWACVAEIEAAHEALGCGLD